MKPILKKIGRSLLWTIVVLILVCAGLFYIAVQPGGSGVLASLRLQDGSEYMVTQRCNWSAEPYTVAFYMRSGGGPWGWCYIDHQASRWRGVDMVYDESSDSITVTERGTWRAALDRKRKAFAIGDGQPDREVDAPQTTPAQPEFAFR